MSEQTVESLIYYVSTPDGVPDGFDINEFCDRLAEALPDVDWRPARSDGDAQTRNRLAQLALSTADHSRLMADAEGHEYQDVLDTYCDELEKGI